MSMGSALKVALFVGVLLAIVALARKAVAAEGESLLSLLKRGTRLEFTTKPGGLSFMTFVVTCFLALTFASSAELVRLVDDIFRVQAGDRDFSANQAMAWALCTLVLNFVFVAWMRGSKRRR